jgi:uncharacterized protein (UPF0548 family)
MFVLRRPTPDTVDRFLRGSQDLPLSYSPVGIAATGPAGYDHDETVAAIGRGLEDFQRARAAVHAWKPFDLGWVDLLPRNASVTNGTVVAVVIHHLGFWSMNGCRVVYTWDERARAGFAYGTIVNHAEEGEELFEVFLDPATDEVMYRIAAVSRPRSPLARLGYPIARMLQARFRRDSVAAMTRAIAGAQSSSSSAARRSMSS